MSETYSMNELLAWIEKQCSLVDGEWGCASSCEDECKGPKEAIIAKLRAADNPENKSLMRLAADLEVSFSAAKILEDHVRTEYDARLRAADKLCMIMNKIANWLERQIALTERLEKVNRGTFDSLADSCVLDEKTYRAQLEEVRKAITDYKGKA